MTGIVLKRKSKNHVLVMQTNGVVTRIRSKTATIGDTLSLNVATAKTAQRRSFIVHAIMSMCLIFTISYATPVGTLDIDINPSVSINYNIFKRVIRSYGRNSDGDLLLSLTETSLNNKSIHSALTVLLSTAQSNAYLKEAEDLLMISAPANLVASITKTLNDNPEQTAINWLIVESKTNFHQPTTEHSDAQDYINQGLINEEIKTAHPSTEAVNKIIEKRLKKETKSLEKEQKNNEKDESDVENDQNENDTAPSGSDSKGKSEDRVKEDKKKEKKDKEDQEDVETEKRDDSDQNDSDDDEAEDDDGEDKKNDSKHKDKENKPNTSGGKSQGKN